MTDRAVTLDPAAESNIAYVEELLARNDLPVADVREKPDSFYIARADGESVGIGGLEPHGSAGLLRSVVVEDGTRGRGIGTAICDALEAEARTQGIDRLYLLTTTAADFFESRGYERIDRETVPEAIAATDEFAELCPSSATCMRKPV